MHHQEWGFSQCYWVNFPSFLLQHDLFQAMHEKVHRVTDAYILFLRLHSSWIINCLRKLETVHFYFYILWYHTSYYIWSYLLLIALRWREPNLNIRHMFNSEITNHDDLACINRLRFCEWGLTLLVCYTFWVIYNVKTTFYKAFPSSQWFKLLEIIC